MPIPSFGLSTPEEIRTLMPKRRSLNPMCLPIPPRVHNVYLILILPANAGDVIV